MPRWGRASTRTEPVPEGAGASAPAVWLVDKPAGPTSHDIVATVRRALGGRGAKVGHAGTLDPFATGLLVLMVGRATRLAPYLSGLDKTYLATLRTGFTSESGDTEGPVRAAGDPATAGEVADVLPAFIGRQRQRVPALSAVKVDGERLYRRTRRGEAATPPEREVEVSGLRVVDDAGDGVVTLEVRCGSGTYVRSLAADIGERLGCGAYLTALRRTRVGGLSVDDAVSPEDVAPGGGLDPLRALAHLPGRELTAAEEAAVSHGGRVADRGLREEAVALTRNGRLVAVAAPDGEGALRPSVVIAAAG
jgi:tRNA pseudouridine55 synthase